MLRQEPFGYFGTLGNVNPYTSEIDVKKAMESKIASKKAVNIQKHVAVDPQRPFTDDEFRCLPSDLEGLETQKLAWCRLSEIVTPKGSLFASKYFSNFTTMPRNPSFLNEVGLLPPFYYQSLFLTPEFTPNGMYRVIVNIQGQFRVVVVDDIIPVYESSMQPIWGLDREVPWQLILLKVWAKVTNGFKNIYAAKPFEFLRTFTYPSWRMKNIDKFEADAAWRFLSNKLQGEIQYNQPDKRTNFQELSHAKAKYDLRAGQTNFTMIAKTKNNQQVAQCGLMPNAASYQIVKLFEVDGKKRAVKIASSIRNRWNGQFSVLDQKVNQFYDPNFHDLTLSKSFILPFDDFRKLFGLILMTPINYKQYLSTKHQFFTVDVPQNHKQAQYYRLQLHEPGQVCFSVIQSIENLVPNLPKPPPPPQQVRTSNIDQSQVLQQVSGSLPVAGGVAPPSFMQPSNLSPRPLSVSSMSSQIPSVPAPSYNIPLNSNLPMNSQVLYSDVRTSSLNQNLQPALYIPPPPSAVLQPQMVSGYRPPSQSPPRTQPPADPWKNTNPWGNPPTVGPGSQGAGQMTGYQSNSRINIPTSQVSGYQSNSRTSMSPPPPPLPQQSGMAQYASNMQVQQNVRPASQDPWLNTNPWPNPPTVQSNISNIPPPPSALGTSHMMAPPVLLPQQSSTYRPNSTGYPAPGTSQTQMDPWKNTNPWGNPPTVNSSIPSGVGMANPSYLNNSRTMSQQQTSTIIAPTSILNPSVGPYPGQRAGTPTNASLLLPQMTPGLPQIQPPNASNYVPPPPGSNQMQMVPPLPNLVRPPLEPVDPWLNRNPWGNEPTVGNNRGPSYLPPLTNTSTVGAISSNYGPQTTTTSQQQYGVSSPYGAPSNYGVPPPPPPNYQTGYSALNQSAGIVIAKPTQPNPPNPWFNTNPWSGPPTAPPSGMRGGGGPQGQPIDPWFNTNPWSGPPTILNQTQPGGSYFEQFGGGVTVGGGSRPVSPSPQGSQIKYDSNARPVSPALIQSQPSGNYYMPVSNFNQNQSPLQPVTTSHYSFVPQSTVQMDPWNNRNPWAGPPIIGPPQGSNFQQTPQRMGPAQGQTSQIPSIPMQQSPPPMTSPRPPSQYGSGVPLSGSQLGYVSQQGTSQIQPGAGTPMRMTSNISNQMAGYSPQGNYPTAQMRSPLAGSGMDPWLNTNPWSGPPVTSVEISSHRQQHSPINNFQQMQIPQIPQIPPPLPNQSGIQQINITQQEHMATIKPPAVQPLQPPESRRQQNNALMATQMNGASVASLQGVQLGQTSNIASSQAYVPHSAQLRFLKTKIVLARLIEDRNNVSTKKKRGSNVPRDELNEPEDGYEYVDIDETHGYTAGQAYFFKLPPGEYILHVKPQACAQPTSYTINFVSQIPVIVSPIALEKSDKSMLLRSCFLDYAEQKGTITYLNQNRTQWVSYGATFNEVGYGFIAFKSERGSAERLYCEFNPSKLRSEGYVCKDIYKNKAGDVGLLSENGMGRCLILKQIKPNAAWPPQSIMIYKAQ